ncbi:hypothetical protein C5K05_26965, partial [Shigella flexneri]
PQLLAVLFWSIG